MAGGCCLLALATPAASAPSAAECTALAAAKQYYPALNKSVNACSEAELLAIGCPGRYTPLGGRAPVEGQGALYPDCVAALRNIGNQPPAAIDFSGFWKEDCADPFGIQVTPIGNGFYAVEACGPGGCSRNLGAPTRFHGDPRFDVLGPTRIRLKGRSSDPDPMNYQKCGQ
jgi:hypothetical protein